MAFTVAEMKALTGMTFTKATTYDQVVAVIEKNQGTSTDIAIANALMVRWLMEERNHEPHEIGARLNLSDNMVRSMSRKGKAMYLVGDVNTLRLQWAQLSQFSIKELTDVIEALTSEPDEDEKGAALAMMSGAEVVKARLGTNTTPERTKAILDASMADGNRTPDAIKKSIPAIAERLEIELPVITRKKSPETAANNKADVATFDQAIATMFAAIEQLHDGTDEQYPLTITSAQHEKLETLISSLTDICIRAEIMEPLTKEGRPAEVTEFAADSEEYTRTA